MNSMDAQRLTGSYSSIAGQLGLASNDCLFLASDVTRLALRAKRDGERFTVDGWIDSFLTVLHRGTLIVPAFTDDLVNGDTFDPGTSPPTTGAVSNKVMRRGDAVRTMDPLHSVFVMGARQQEIVELTDEATFGANSVFGFMHRNKAKMLIVDVDFQHSFTFIHYLEQLWGMKYRRPVHLDMMIRRETGVERRRCMYYAKKPGVSNDLHAYQRELQDRGIVRTFVLDDVPMILLDLDEVASYTRTYFDRGGRVHSFRWLVLVKTMVKRTVPFLATRFKSRSDG